MEGEKTYTCAICNNTKIEKIGIDATKHLHSEIRNQKEASCKEEGYSGDKYCPDCGTKLSSGNTIAKTENHSWNKGVITKKPTCAETGVKTYTCSICSKTKTENIAKTTKHLHTEIRNKKAATCGETGYTGDTYCTDCGTKISSGKTIAKLTTLLGMKERSQQNLLVQRKVFEHLLVVYVPKPKLRALQNRTSAY